MAKMITWKGEDALHDDPDAAPRVNRWGPYKFEKGKPVRVTDETVIRRAGDTRYWKIEDCPGEKPTPASKETKARDDAIMTKALDEAGEKIEQEKRQAEDEEFRQKVAAHKAQEQLEENKKLAAQHAAREAAKPQNRGKVPKSTNDPNGYAPA